ncbi:MAG: hypothetical protein LBK53_06790 [Heliobacteriaceae bacterium]|jgi:hypothetical protein|nr:hypothetical protein [Heliobacteriaceae bacterium]
MKIFVAKIKDLADCKHKAGRILTQQAAQNIYGITDTQIRIKNKKPLFVNAGLNFNISHSEDFVGVCFDKEPLGFDMEYMKKRDFNALLKRYKLPVKDAKTIFYRFWCGYEAKLKLQSPEKTLITFKLFDDYMAALASASEKEITVKAYMFPSMEEIALTEFFKPLDIRL